jgi:hypothetical protein
MQINKVLVTLCFTISNKKIKKKAEYKIVIGSDFYVLTLIKKSPKYEGLLKQIVT